MFAVAVVAAQGPQETPPAGRLDRMFRAHHELIWRTLRRMGLSPDAAADVTQQAFLVAAERLDDIREGSERAFLFGTAIRSARAMFRRGHRWQLLEDMDVHADPTRREEQATSRKHLMELIDGVFAKMDPDLVTVFVLFELEELSTPEIAELVEIPVGTVASRLRRARQVFRAAAARMELPALKQVKP